MVSTGGPLEGVRVLDFSTVGPAARSARWLADYGADVVKIGAPAKAGAVQIEPVFYAYSAHRGMRRIRLDLKADAGREAFLRLAAGADVVVESFRPGVVDRLGIGFDAVRAVNPRIVYCSTSGYGQDGPRSQWAGHDLNYLAVGGYLSCSGQAADGGPALPGATIADSAGGGMQAVMGILAALVQRQSTGEGQHLDVAAADGVLALMSLYVEQNLATGDEPGPRHDLLTGRYACYDLYEASEGGWLSVAAIEPHFWRNLCGLLGHDELADAQMDDARQDEVRAAFRARFKEKTRDEWAAQLGPADTCVAPVLTIAEAAADEQYAARGAIVEASHPTEGTFRQVGPLLAGQPGQGDTVEVPDWTQTSTDEILAEVGFSPDELAALRADEVIA
jgi:alpha-methylacyl-CoA racemase